MGRCRHDRHVRVREYHDSEVCYDLEPVGVVSACTNVCGPTGMVHVQCYDCGLDREYGRRRPAWLQMLMEKFILKS